MTQLCVENIETGSLVFFLHNGERTFRQRSVLALISSIYDFNCNDYFFEATDIDFNTITILCTLPCDTPQEAITEIRENYPELLI